MRSDDRYPAAAPTLADFLNWMLSNETQDDGLSRWRSRVEDIRETADAAFGTRPLTIGRELARAASSLSLAYGA
jgi:hypothetical protein